MSASKLAQETAGAILRNVAIDPRPIAIGRAGQGRTSSNGAAPSEEASARGPSGSAPAPAQPVDPAGLPGYQEGFRAGLAAAEAAQRSREQAHADATQRAGFERGREEGRAQGVAEGRDAGRQQAERDAHAARETASSRLAQLDRLLASLPAELARRLEAAEEDMVVLCHAALCRILGEEVVSRDGVTQIVRQAVRDGGFLGVGASVGQLAIHVHPQELEALESDAMLAAWLRQHAAAGVVRWVPDERVKLGGCLVRSGEGTIDARLETQLAALQRVLVDGRAAKQAAEASAAASPEPGEGRA